MPTDSISYMLLTWYDFHGRKNLPWQTPRTPYRVWISEVMLQQTQVQTVLAYFERFMHHFPSLPDLANAHEDEVLALWSGLGYYSRARNMHETAKRLMSQYQGEFPKDCASLMALPGIGESTAAAIVSQAFDLPAAILDGNVKRVLTRLFRIEGYPETSLVKKKLWALAKECMPTTRCADYTQAIMDLGATLCTPKKPNCSQCPLQQKCLAFQHQEVTLYPHKKAKKLIPVEHQQFLVLYNEKKQVYLEKRPSEGLWGGLWCLPSLAENECPLGFIQSQYQWQGENAQEILRFKHQFSHFHLKIKALSIQVNTSQENNWFHQAQLGQLGLAAPTSKILRLFHGATI